MEKELRKEEIEEEETTFENENDFYEACIQDENTEIEDEI